MEEHILPQVGCFFRLFFVQSCLQSEARERGPGDHMLRAVRAGGETEPTGFEVSPCFEKKKPQTKSEASFFEAGDGNRTHVFSLEG